MPPEDFTQLDNLVRSTLLASVQRSQPSDDVWDRIQRQCEADRSSIQPSSRSWSDKFPINVLVMAMSFFVEVLRVDHITSLLYEFDGSASVALLRL